MKLMTVRQFLKKVVFLVPFYCSLKMNLNSKIYKKTSFKVKTPLKLLSKCIF